MNRTAAVGTETRFFEQSRQRSTEIVVSLPASRPFIRQTTDAYRPDGGETSARHPAWPTPMTVANHKLQVATDVFALPRKLCERITNYIYEPTAILIVHHSFSPCRSFLSAVVLFLNLIALYVIEI